MTTARTVRVFAPAKINLFLHVGERRGDGYHALQSLVVFADIGDELRLRHARGLALSVEGPFASSLAGQGDNLVLSAARVVAEEARMPAAADIVLTKNLPVASGIGGGSADAAAAMRGLVRLWRIFPDEPRLLARAATIGSDVPVCVASAPAWMEGRGDIIVSAGVLPRLPLVLVNPGVPVSTADVFRALKSRRGTAMERPRMLQDGAALLEFLATTTNDLEAPARALQPAIGDVIEELSAQPGALMTRMSGSGATCFAIFASEPASAAATKALGAAHLNWWVRAAHIAPNNIGAVQ